MKIILDIDGKHFDRSVQAIRKELEAMTNIYLPPRVRGGLMDLGEDIEDIVNEMDVYRTGQTGLSRLSEPKQQR
jgi:hypothetical protein